MTIPTPESGDVFSLQNSLLAPETYFGGFGTIPPVLMNGLDVTRQLVGGKIGESITLRDQTLPRYQAELDIAAVELADRFRAEGLRLFSNSTGSVPDPNLPYAGSAQVGFAGNIQVNAAVRSDVRLLRDGTETIAGTAPFTPNPVGGPAGFVKLIDRILSFSFGETASSGVSWGGFATTGLGPDGTLSSPFGSPRTIEDYVGIVTAIQTADGAAAKATLETAKQFSDGLEARFAKESKVDVDSELASLIQLQNAYAANARVMSTAQSMWSSLFDSVR
jgi:flagellar hook-associated protein 1 FlgK